MPENILNFPPEQKFSWNCFNNNDIFFHLSLTSSHLHPLQVENCGSNSRLVMDEDDNGKFRLKRVNEHHNCDCFKFLFHITYSSNRTGF